ncbi:MAG: CoA transferase subunit A [Chloroflexi bacterium]|nr:CoA transferase subunit A [Chloroflexota bacterium]
MKDGDSIAVGGAWLSSHPMAIIRQIIRSKIKNLSIMTILGSVDIDLLVGAGCVDRLMFSFVSLEAFGLPPNFRRPIEKGRLKYAEITGLAIILGFEAAGRGVPFLPYRGPFGSDCVKERPEFYKTIKCPFTGEEMMAVPAIKPDVAIIHAQRADPAGSIQIEGTGGSDLELAKAAKKVIVSVEEIVSPEVIRENPYKTKIPRFYVDMVIEAPFGAHPTSSLPSYVTDPWHMIKYMEAAATPDTFKGYLDQFVMKSEDEYLEAVGGVRQFNLLKKLAREVKLL